MDTVQTNLFDIQLGDVQRSAKKSGHGKAAVLSKADRALLFEKGLTEPKWRALFAVCLFTGCRISEALQLKAKDIDNGLITFRKAATKTKATRQVPISPQLKYFLEAYDYAKEPEAWVFPGRWHSRCTRQGADKVLKQACAAVGLTGISTHSFRRTYITDLRNQGHSPTTIRKSTGHKTVAALIEYFE